jgi:hypothetical protein
MAFLAVPMTVSASNNHSSPVWTYGDCHWFGWHGYRDTTTIYGYVGGETQSDANSSCNPDYGAQVFVRVKILYQGTAIYRTDYSGWRARVTWWTGFPFTFQWTEHKLDPSGSPSWIQHYLF